MERQALSDSQLEQLKKCVQNGRLGDNILFASSALFVRFLRRTKRLSLGTGAFVASRYGALLVAILALSPARHAPTVDSAGAVILAIRTWAIWGKSRKILWALIVFSLSAVIPAAIIIGKSLGTNSVRPLITPELADICSATFGDIPGAFIVPYILTIIYEIMTLSLSLFRIAKWRKCIPENIRAPFLTILWRDGVLYFTFVLLLSFMNIGIILQSEAPQLRTGGGNLQAVLHSAVATRIVLVHHFSCFTRLI
ncbi:hypothetical protein L218DRAFT_186435 [Marasmius fiardii PR-910]|nr:hypothetical protein L218DRAFT_186435 [Marasmius fiardii PR-910]